ncbi:hypothetical protein HO173_007123 [Letharia columbiana]|uniref:Nickel/cobalt efflux system n=1 Tax=Letharia columbiana TaxID=112416 RepID=A0A8H6FTK7_9LECA|nr:uncharacterized protein HO173_007123 [Letharia columbiana]KAF6234498.1 hypothetical protein HO173_007123 [Letharia columbiana]
MGFPALKNGINRRAIACHGRIPGLRTLPFPAVGIIVGLVFANAIVWVAIGILLHFHIALVSTAVLSYTLGLRHALDADHISAIDLMTRRLIASGQRPVTVGTFFSLGHSTIVIVTSVVVAATASAISSRFGAFSKIGGIIGTSVSAGFLIILGIMNIYILHKLVQLMRKLIASAPGDEQSFEIKGAGCLFYLFKRIFKLIDRPWKMCSPLETPLSAHGAGSCKANQQVSVLRYPLGLLFGLGFDTSSEVALLGIASIQGAKGTSIWLILIFPVLFTVGMCLLDTIDGALMMALYTSTALAKDQIAILYYSIVLTVITVMVAMIIGFVQLLTLVLNVAQPSGGAICGSFVVLGGLSALLYKPWRRRIDRRRERHPQHQQLQNDKELGTLPELNGVLLDFDVSQRDGETPTNGNDNSDNPNVFEAEILPTFTSCHGAPSRSAVV